MDTLWSNYIFLCITVLFYSMGDVNTPTTLRASDGRPVCEVSLTERPGGRSTTIHIKRGSHLGTRVDNEANGKDVHVGDTNVNIVSNPAEPDPEPTPYAAHCEKGLYGCIFIGTVSFVTWFCVRKAGKKRGEEKKRERKNFEETSRGPTTLIRDILDDRDVKKAMERRERKLLREGLREEEFEGGMDRRNRSRRRNATVRSAGMSVGESSVTERSESKLFDGRNQYPSDSVSRVGVYKPLEFESYRDYMKPPRHPPLEGSHEFQPLAVRKPRPSPVSLANIPSSTDLSSLVDPRFTGSVLISHGSLLSSVGGSRSFIGQPEKKYKVSVPEKKYKVAVHEVDDASLVSGDKIGEGKVISLKVGETIRLFPKEVANFTIITNGKTLKKIVQEEEELKFTAKVPTRIVLQAGDRHVTNSDIALIQDEVHQDGSTVWRLL